MAVLALFALAAQLAIPVAGASPPTIATGRAAVDSDLTRQFEVKETSRFVVEFNNRPDLRGPAAIEDFTERGEAVVDALRGAAARSQREALALVASRGFEAEAFWFRNVIIVEGDAALAEALAGLAGVKEVRPERIYPLVRPVERRAAERNVAAAPEWGVAQIGADQAWEQGILGGGIVVANIDTGVDYTHPALTSQYRGSLGDGSFVHDYNWWDPSGICGDEPCDNVEHGTHVMGTMVGGDGPGPFFPDIGVAPGARWIAAKGCEDFGCSESSLLSSGQWVIAPTDLNGENPDPSKRPDIVNNSWGGGPGDAFYLETVQNWRAVGIIPVFASGNPGPFCGEGGSPGDYVESFSVGATDINDVIADFSGRGPSAFGKINPDVAAPGVDVTSSVPGGGYATFSGTSMAAPHTAGTLALMLSAAPALIGDFDGVTGSLSATALDIIDLSCGGDESGDPNNVYGEGRIDALAAVELVASGGTLQGTITAADTANPIGGASVSANNGEREFSTVSDASGSFNLFLAEGDYLVTASAFGFETIAVSGVTIETDQTTTLDMSLTRLPSFTLRGVVRRAETNRPVANASVRALGTPVPAVATNADGEYSVILPLGNYEVEASQGGCLSRESKSVELIANRNLNFKLVRKIDNFGYGCRPIKPVWVDVKRPTTMYGDDTTGRMPMPFPFPFYGEEFDKLFIASNGYVAFEDAYLGYSDPYNTSIPNTFEPNAAVFGAWQDLWVINDAHVDWGMRTGKKGLKTLIIEYADVPAFGSDAGANFEIKLRDNGVVDLVYGAGMENILSGRNATAGIEAPGGTDGLQLSFQQRSLTTDSAWRIKKVPTGHVAGVVTNANDGLPVAGATVTALPSGRTATTDENGNYELLLVPGNYLVTISANNYVSESMDIRIRRDEVTPFDAALKAARAEVSPTSISASTALGEVATQTVTIANTGSAPLVWEARERDNGGTPPELPPLPTLRVVRPTEWAPFVVPDGFGPSVAAQPVFAGDLDPIIQDPAGDANGSVDITTVGGGADDFEISMEIGFTQGTPMDRAVGIVFVDTDQNPSTGLPAEAFFGLPTQDVGMEYFVDLFGAPGGFGYVVDANTFELVGEIAVETVGQSYRFDVPLFMLGFDDGFVNVDMVMGDFNQPTDWAANVGHGTIEPFRDAPWMDQSPQLGTIPAGGSTEVTLILGGPDVGPGNYSGLLAFRTNDPRIATHTVDVELAVELPANFGALTGIVTNGRAGFPVPATVTVAAEDGGAPLVVTTTADDVSGEYQIFLPEGRWPLTADFEGYATFSGEVSVFAGNSASFDIAIDPLWANASLEGGPLEFSLVAGETASAELVLSNLGGLADLEFEVLERAGAASEPAQANQIDRALRRSGLTTNDTAATPGGAVERIIRNGSQVLIFQDQLPWGSDALQQVLDNNAITYDLVGSSDMATIDMTDYEVVFISNDQPQRFYNAYSASADRFETYVADGGFLWVGAAAWGWNGGDATGLPLPGGVTVAGPLFESRNVVVQTDHPTMVGVPETFTGTEASHTSFDNSPEGSTVAIGAQSRAPTMVEYGVGSGRVMAFGQTLEFAWMEGQDGALILENAVPYALAFDPFVDLPWISATPASGTIVPDGSETLSVGVDATGLEPGVYTAQIAVRTNDPLNRIIRVAVTLTVTA